MPDRYVVLGHPVAHSRSPFIHARFAEQTGEPVAYGRIDCGPGGADGFVAAARAFAAEGGRGCNVTVPFKFEALNLAREASERARRAGAANVLAFDAEGWRADNTDGIGLVRDITAHAGVALRGRRVLLVGAGGAGAGVLGPLIEAGTREIVIANRTAAKARALVERHAAWAERHGTTLAVAPLESPGRAFDIVLNASSTSLQGAASPVPATVLKPGALAVDLMYGPAAEPFLAWARGHGAVARDGLGMLVEQAAEAFWFWRGVRPETPPVLAALRAAIEADAAAAGPRP